RSRGGTPQGGIAARSERPSSGSSLGGEPVAEEAVVVVPRPEIRLLGLKEAVAQLLDAMSEVVGVVGLGPEVGDDVLKLTLVVEVAENHVDLADDQLEHVQL